MFTAVASVRRRRRVELARVMAARAARMLEAAEDASHLALQRALLEGPYSGRIYHRGEHLASFLAGSGYGVKFVSFTAHAGQESSIHQASAPGESPHAYNDADSLLRNIDVVWVKGRNSMSVTLGWSGKWKARALALDLGRADGHIAPRPFRFKMKVAGKQAMAAALR